MKEQKITGNIKPDNKDLEILKQHFPQCFDKNGNFDFERFKKEISPTEINFSKESYGLDWLGKSYARLLATDETDTLLKPDEDWNFKEENRSSRNLLLKGDNLDVLKHLSNAYHEKIKMIYIDPPYNTGSDGFVYQDNRKFTVKQLQELAGISEERAKRIFEFTRSKSNSHSAWLTFMYPRLYIARRLLKEDGVIFVSIDDNEVAQLRLLMDEIFGEENFVEIFIWDKKNSAKGVPPKNMVVNIHEYILCYSKSEDVKLIGEKRTTNTFSNPDNDPRGLWRLSNIKSTLENNNKFTIIDPKTGNKFTNFWAFSKESLQKMILENRIVFPKKTTGLPKQKEFFNEFSNVNMPIKSQLGRFDAQDTYEKKVDIMLGAKTFPYRKPTKLIKKLIEQIGNNNDLILDFFAGSGTTGDAVMQLNAEDGGNRQFILVQLPEPIDPKKNKTAYEFVKNELGVEKPKIFDITRERLVRSAAKLSEDTKNLLQSTRAELKRIQSKEKPTKRDQDKISRLQAEIKNLQEKKDRIEKMDRGFKIFETVPLWENYHWEADEFMPQLPLFDESKLNSEDLKTLLVTWKTFDGIPLTQDAREVDLGNYTAYYVEGTSGNKLYLLDKEFTTENIKKLLEKIDRDKAFNPTVIIAFGYPFESKILREIAENIKAYSNKKGTDIDFIIRY